MIDPAFLHAYAKTILVNGAALQKGQPLLLQSEIETADFARIVMEEAYALGASDVCVIWNDEMSRRIRIDHASAESLRTFDGWMLDRSMRIAEKNGCSLNLVSPNIHIMENVDPQRMMTANRTVSGGMRPFSKLKTSSQIRWCVAAVPNRSWARDIFPGLSPEEALDRLWGDILRCAYVDSPETALESWKDHIDRIVSVREKLNTFSLTGLHFKNQAGTDLRVGLVDDPKFVGGTCVSPDGIPFAPNIPTEEVFGVPHRDKAWGTMVSSKPLIYAGNLIEDIFLRFSEGRIVEAKAGRGEDILRQLIQTDEGSHRLGECSMVSGKSSVGQAGHLFYTTLYDENAACHIAVGNGYSDGVGGKDRSESRLRSMGLNESMIHVDIMVGTDDMQVTGTTSYGSEILLFDGDFVIG